MAFDPSTIQEEKPKAKFDPSTVKPEIPEPTTAKPPEEKKEKTFREKAKSIAESGGYGAAAGALAPELMTLGGLGAAAFPPTAPLSPFLLAGGQLLRGGRMASALAGGLSGAAALAFGVRYHSSTCPCVSGTNRLVRVSGFGGRLGGILLYPGPARWGQGGSSPVLTTALPLYSQYSATISRSDPFDMYNLPSGPKFSPCRPCSRLSRPV